MGAESLPIVCKFCREPLRWVDGHYIEKRSGDRHFLGDKCPVVEGLGRATQVAQGGERVRT